MQEATKKSLKLFAFIFVASFIVINWDGVSWVFNYKEVGGLVEAFFNPYADNDILAKKFSPQPGAATQNPASASQPNQDGAQNLAKVQAVYPYTYKENSIEIPAINLVTPLVLAQNTDKQSMAEYLDQGATYYPGSVQPGQNGQMVVLGHSAPAGWPQIKHDWIFTKLQSLNVGDQIVLNFNNRQYTYTVKNKTVIAQGQEISSPQNAQVNTLVLVSCWPPGKNYQRMAVEAELNAQAPNNGAF